MVLVELITTSAAPNYFDFDHLVHSNTHTVKSNPSANAHPNKKPLHQTHRSKFINIRPCSLFSLCDLAESCAASLIQRQWRLHLLHERICRRSNANKELQNNDAIDKEALIIQAAWRRYVAIRNSCRIQDDERNRHHLHKQYSEKDERYDKINHKLHLEFGSENENQKDEESYLPSKPDSGSIPYESNHSSAHRIQNFIGYEETASSNDEIVYPNGVDRMSTREEVVKTACKIAQAQWQQHAIELEDVDIVKLLEALQIISSTDVVKENIVSVTSKQKQGLQQSSTLSSSEKASLNLNGSARELSSALGKAWERIETKTIKRLRRSLSTKHKKKIPMTAAKMAKKYMRELLHMPEKVLNFLVTNEETIGESYFLQNH